MKYVARLIDTGADAYGKSPNVCFRRPSEPTMLAALNVIVERIMRKHNGYVALELREPFRPRSTGPRSQNSRLFGHSEDIAEQITKDGKPVYTKRQIHDAMLRMAVSEGYPTYLDINGAEAPLPDEQASVEQLNIVLKVQQRYADIHNFWLHEYIEEGPLKGMVYKSIGGRSYEEMKRHAPELNADLGVGLIEEEE